MKRNIFLHFCSLIVPLLWSVSALAANTVKIELAEIANNGEATVNVVFSADEDFICFQTEVNLPDGMEAVMSDSRYAFLPDGISATHQISSNLVGNTLKIVSFSADNSKYPRSGTLFSFRMRPMEGFKGGNVTVENTVFTTADFQDVSFAATTIWLDEEMQIGSITLSQTSAQLKAGESVTLTASVLPATATDKTVTWSSSDETVATVDANGKVTAIAVGEATITATCGSVSASTSCKVTVVPTPAESITLSQSTAQLKAGEFVTLTASVLPETTTDKTVTWSSDNTAIATVDAEGKVTAIAIGEATITATCGSVSANCKVTVVATPAESITLSQSTAQLKAGESVTLTATVLPATTTDKTVTWSSDNTAIATVDAEGKVTAIAIGEATITATCGSVSANCKVTVVATPAESITLSQSTAQLKAGESVTLTATVLPATTTDKTVTWSSDNTAIATVDANGKVTAIAVGETTITATCGSVSANCKVTVVATPVESITLSQTTAQLKAGESVTLTATVLPATTTDKTVIWTSNNYTIATVDANGKVKAIAIGEATITATCGGVSATCKVSVVATPAESITLSQTSVQLKAGESVTLTASVLPETTTYKTVTWSSSDEAVATVNVNGKVTALAIGEAVITAKCGSVTAACKVRVMPTPAESITLSQTTAQLKAGESVTLTASVLPATTTDKSVTWSSNNSTVATVDVNGKVTAIAVGEATITATCGSVSANCKVRVMPILAESITLSHESWNGEEGESFTLVATVLPENTTDKTVSWSSSDPEIATVDAEGHVSVLKVGYCTITASTQDGSNLSAECIITSASGIDDLFTDSEARFDVYNLQGVLLKKGCGRDYLKQLSIGAYILRQGNVSKKVIIR